MATEEENINPQEEPTEEPTVEPTQGPTEELPFVCNLTKCQSCDEESFLKNLCETCNNNDNYYPINPKIIFHKNDNNGKYIECYNNSTKPYNFYLNKKTHYYEPCYKSCASCEYNGDGIQNNCTTCDVDYIKDPENINSTNCVAHCSYYYYISYNQYKCTELPQCPDESNLLIRAKKKCIENCSKDNIYKYQYNGECFENCPNDTIKDEVNYLCKVPNTESCTLSSSKFELYDFLKEGGVEKIAKIYSTEFNYTNKHISLYINEVYSIILYKSKECIFELGLSLPEIDFGDCYKKVQQAITLNNKANSDLIVAIIDKKSSKKPNPITSYAFYHPETGKKIDSETICKGQTIVVKENIKTLLNESKSNYDSIIYLTGQNIDIFNISSEFYTSICYHFDSPCNKDVALRDRLLVYYPNITLCDQGCLNRGVNLTSMMALCECKYKDLNDENKDENNNIYKDVVNTVNKILDQVNLGVMECYKDLFKYKYFVSNTGGIMVLGLIFVEISVLIYYYFSSLFFVNKYIYNITENYLLYLNKSPMVNTKVIKLNKNNNENNNDNDSKNSLKCPPKKIPSDIFNINRNSSKNY